MKKFNGGKYNKVNSTQARILHDAGRTIINMVTLEGVKLEGALGLIHVMVRALDVGRISKLSSTKKFQASTVDESASLITDKGAHRCKACGKTDTLSPNLN